MTDSSSRREVLHALAGTGVLLSGASIGSAQSRERSLILRPKWNLTNLATSVPIEEFEGVHEQSYASWVENGELAQTWLSPSKANRDRIPAKLVLFRVYDEFVIPAWKDTTATTGTVSVGGDGWAELDINDPVSYDEFCGDRPYAVTVDQGEGQSELLTGEGELAPGQYIVKVDPPCTIDLGGGSSGPTGPTVSDINGAPVPDATVLVYDSESGDLRDSYATDRRGALPSDVDFSAESLVVVKKSGWFDVLSDSPSEVTLDKQVLSYPTPVDRNGDTYATAAVWRAVNPTDHREQVLYTELVDANEMTDVNGESEYEIAYDATSSKQSLGDGFFTISYPQSKVHVDRATYPSDTNGMEPADATVLGRYQAMTTGSELSAVERWHPLRTDLPVYPFPTDRNGDRFTTLTGNEEQLETANSLLKLGATTALGSLGTVIEGANTLFGDSIRGQLTTTRRVGDYNIGDEVTEEEFKRATSPADHDSVTQSWAPGAVSPLSAVTQAVPLTIDESADRCSVIARASWNQFGGKAIFSTDTTLWPIRSAPGE